MQRCGITLLILLRCRTSFVRTLRYLIRILTVFKFTVDLEHDSRFFMHPSTTWPHEGFATRNNRSLSALMRLASRESENLPPSGFRPRIGRFSCRTLRACGAAASCAWRTREVSRTVHGHTTRGIINATSAAPPPHAPRAFTHRAPTRTHPTRPRCAPYPFEAYTTLSAAFSQAGSLKMRKPRCRSASHSPAAASPTESAPFGHAFTQ